MSTQPSAGRSVLATIVGWVLVGVIVVVLFNFVIGTIFWLIRTVADRRRAARPADDLPQVEVARLTGDYFRYSAVMSAIGGWVSGFEQTASTAPPGTVGFAHGRPSMWATHRAM